MKWELEEKEMSYGQAFVVNDEYGDPLTHPFLPEESALLISAAPDLLNARRMVVERWKTDDLAEAARLCEVATVKAGA